jgi:hypothetical protein
MLFSKKITTVKANPFQEMKTAINAAIGAAVKAGVPSGIIQRELASRAADFERAEQARIERRQYDPQPQLFDPVTYAPIDSHAEAARREERRIKEELRRQQAEYARSVDERGRAEARRRGEIL